MSNVGHLENRFFVPFLRVVTALGFVALLYSLVRLDLALLDLRFAALFGMALLVSSRIVVPLPRLSGQISVSDTFVFLFLLLYGVPAAVLVASTEAFFSSLRFNRKPQTVFFNWGCSAVSIFITGLVLEISFGDVTALPIHPFSATFVVAICTMALAHYASNSGIVAIGTALKTSQPIWQTWRKHYLWTSITYFVGASAAGVISALVHLIGISAFVVTLPIIGIVFLTYRTYLKNVETAATTS